jgi:Na+/proline symporter/signal transduction histidine kinase/ActR/RegA family two-component response regulator
MSGGGRKRRMFESWTILFAGLAYVGLLFAVATWGDRLARQGGALLPRSFIYALSLGVYCTSWTYFGSVGVASRSGWDFLPIYIGPVLVFTAGWKILQTIVDIAKRHNITSIADFIAARYGKSEHLGALVAVIAVIGIVPYISIQLKAVSFALQTVMTSPALPSPLIPHIGAAEDLALLVTIAMAVFAMLFGTRHIDTTEHQDGLMMAIAVESIVKLLAFLAVGLFITFGVAGGFDALIERASAIPGTIELFTKGFAGGAWLTMTLLSMIAIMLLPRQFHVTVVENASPKDLRRASWLFPAYLVAINIFVVPIAIAGLVFLRPGSADGDTFVLALPVFAGSKPFALIAFLGGLSAATAMVIVEAVALSIMVCNNLVVPIILRRHDERAQMHQDMGRLLINIRRWAIAFILILAYSYYRMIGSTAALAQIGLISFAAIAQFAPAFFGGLVWKRATAQGATAGIIAGAILWAYTLLLPSFSDAGWIAHSFIDEGPFGLGFLRPRMLLNLSFDPLTHGVVWSLLVNCAAYVAFSFLRQLTPIERLQANSFIPHERTLAAAPSFRLWRSAVTVGELEQTVSRYLGLERTRRACAELADGRGQDIDPHGEADIRTLRFAEHLLASAVGAASSRLVMALLLERHSKNPRGAIKLLDDASAAIQYNRDLLQSAIDNVAQGIAVFDRELQLICWNRQFRRLLGLAADIGRIGVPLEEVVRALMRNAATADNELASAVDEQVRRIVANQRTFQVRLAPKGEAIEVRSNPMPDGGFVVTFTDVSEQVRASEALERRVEERTAELVALNAELGRAKSAAETANLGKTRFIAAASHDILQPLHAARLFTSSLVERKPQGIDGKLALNVDASLEAVEEILSALLDISRLDAGAMKPDISTFIIGDLLQALGREFEPAAKERGVEFKVVQCSLAVKSDRKLLRRVLQNLVSNAIKYAGKGKVLMGCRRRGDEIRIEVCDNGPGIPANKHRLVFQEFERLGRDKGEEPGLGLGLAIVERIAKMLSHPIGLRSQLGRGTTFSITVPIAREGAVAQQHAAKIKIPADRISGLTILVVDNEPAILEGMESLLGGWGARIVTARSAAEAIAAFEASKHSIDMLIADFHLHREDGLAVIESIRSRAGRPIPAILITADRSVRVQELAASGNVQYLRKPVRPAALRAALARLTVQLEAAE